MKETDRAEGSAGETVANPTAPCTMGPGRPPGWGPPDRGPVRRWLRRIHLAAGSVTALLLLFTATTGALLVFEPELDTWLNPGIWSVDPDGEPASLEAAAANVRQARPGEDLAAVTRYADPDRPLVMVTESGGERTREIFVDPYRGTVIGDRDYQSHLFAAIERLHRQMWLGNSGRWLPAVAALLILLLVPTGIALWWPGPRPHRWRRHLVPMWTGNGKRFLYDCHRIGGLYLSILLVVIGGTGLMMSGAMGWPRAAVFQALDGRGAPPAGLFQYRSDPVALAGPPATLDEVLAAVPETAAPYVVQHVLTPMGETGVYWVLNQRSALRFDDFYIDRYSGELLGERRHEDQTRAERTLLAADALHTGTAFGMPGRIVWFVAAMLAPLLGLSGLLIWFNRGLLFPGRSGHPRPLIHSDSETPA